MTNFVSSMNSIARKVANRFSPRSQVRKSLAYLWSSFLNRLGLAIELKVNGELVRLSSQYRSLSEHYEPEAMKALKWLLKDADLFVDIGANVGLFSIFAARHAPHSCRLLAIEANPKTAHLLKSHLKMNGYQNRVEVLQFAVSSRSREKIQLKEPGAGCLTTRLNLQTLEKGSDNIVSSLALDDLIDEKLYKKIVLKIDVEGAELLVLEGAKNLLANHSSLKMILAVHPMFISEFKTNVTQIINFLHQHHFSVYSLSGQLVSELDYAEYIVTKTPPEFICNNDVLAQSAK